MATPSTAEKRLDARRTIGLLAPAIAGPVASIWTNSLFRQNSLSRDRRVSADMEQSSVGVRFTLTKTEDAMDSVFPCVAEELFRPMMRNKFGNADKLNFHFDSQ